MEIVNIRIKPLWPKSKEEIWEERFEHLAEPKKRFFMQIPIWYYAASLLIPFILFGFLYTVNESTARGEHVAIQLPDRSTVTLNSESKLSYKPFIWFISRKIGLEGEACFEVKQGRQFSVLSGQNRVNVLGTTFNVFARTEIFRVNCLTGQVEVRAGQETVVLNPNMQAVFFDGALSLDRDVTPARANGWMQGKFVFVETPLKEVIAEVERQYNIQVTPNIFPNHYYTGSFSKTDNTPEDILKIIGKAFGIIFSYDN